MPMHYEVLDDKRRALLPALGAFKKDFYLSLLDIGCMKLGAIVSRAELKDYVDLFFILSRVPLPDLIAGLARKTPTLDRNLALKALVSFEDVAQDPIDFTKGSAVTFDEIRASIIERVGALPLGIR